MVDKIHYRWDFIGLSTDSKPTPAESPKVVDGSTFYESNTSKLYVFYKDTWYEKTGSGGGTSYTAGDGIDITGNTISVDTTDIQEKLTAGSNITISGENEISATDTTYSNFTGTDGTSAGTAGLVPAPASTDAGKFLKADGTWDTAGGGSGPTVVQTTGTSTTDVMSQKAVTDELYHNNNKSQIQIGNLASSLGDDYFNSIAIGASSRATKMNSLAIGSTALSTASEAIAIGSQTQAYYQGSIALGYGSHSTAVGNMHIGTTDTTYGYNSSNYRLLSGVYDPQSAHDAATKGYVDAHGTGVMYIDNNVLSGIQPGSQYTGLSICSDAALTDDLTGEDFRNMLDEHNSIVLVGVGVNENELYKHAVLYTIVPTDAAYSAGTGNLPGIRFMSEDLLTRIEIYPDAYDSTDFTMDTFSLLNQ